jgi:hypothetical protein
VPAPAELLWPGAQLYVSAAPSAEGLYAADLVRIAAAPAQERGQPAAFPELATALAQGTAIGLIGSGSEPGVYLLEAGGTVRQLWIEEQDAHWAGAGSGVGADPDGVVVSLPEAATGRNGFTWVRGDGLGVQVWAQPYHNVHGVVSDLYAGLWWIETPQAALDQWQLWHYDPARARIALRLQASSDLFRTIRVVEGGLVPHLVALEPVYDAASGRLAAVHLILDTLNERLAKLNRGVFRITVSLPDEGVGAATGLTQLLISPLEYRGPLQVSPDQSKLAFTAYDEETPSLTSGFVRPSNSLRILTLAGRGAGAIRTVYRAETRFEFLAPELDWQGGEHVLAARSRFTAGDPGTVDSFGLAQVAASDLLAGQAEAASHLLPGQQSLQDFAGCRAGAHSLFMARVADDAVELARWDGENPPQPILAFPPNLDRLFVCWQAPR